LGTIELVPLDGEELDLMRRIDEIHLKHPFYGRRKIALARGLDGLRAR
jgi:hypothetical protein